MDFKQSNSESLSVLVPATTTQVTVGQSITLGPFDVRSFSSYYLAVKADVVGVPTQFNAVQVSPVWYDTAQLSTILYEDLTHFWANGSAPFSTALGGNLGSVTLQDQIHGPFMTVVLARPLGTDTISFTYKLEATTRSLGQPYQRGLGSETGDIIITPPNVALPNGSTAQLFGGLTYGRHRINVSIGAGGVGFNMMLADRNNAANNYNVLSQGLAGGANLTTELILPKRAPWISIFNGSGAASTYTAYLTRMFDSV